MTIIVFSPSGVKHTTTSALDVLQLRNPAETNIQ
jgi:hypothetical protein